MFQLIEDLIRTSNSGFKNFEEFKTFFTITKRFIVIEGKLNRVMSIKSVSSKQEIIDIVNYSYLVDEELDRIVDWNCKSTLKFQVGDNWIIIFEG